MSLPTFDGLRVLSLESRRAREMVTLIATHGGRPTVAPSMREVPLESNTEALAFADALIRGEFDVVVLLTGVGTRVLLDVVGRVLGGTADFVAALGRMQLAVRGPKPHAAIREVGLTPWVLAPEPNTWRELVAAIDAPARRPWPAAAWPCRSTASRTMNSCRRWPERGAAVTPVPIYQWALPEDLEPLGRRAGRWSPARSTSCCSRRARRRCICCRWPIGSGSRDGVRAVLRRTVVASIGPTTSEELHAAGHGRGPRAVPSQDGLAGARNRRAGRARCVALKAAVTEPVCLRRHPSPPCSPDSSPARPSPLALSPWPRGTVPDADLPGPARPGRSVRRPHRRERLPPSIPSFSDAEEQCEAEYEALLNAIHEDELFAPVDIQRQEQLVEQIAAALPEAARTLIVELADNHARHVWMQQEGAYHLGLAVGRRLRRTP